MTNPRTAQKVALVAIILHNSVPASAQQSYDMRGMDYMRTGQARATSGAQGQGGYVTRTTQRNVITDRRLHSYRGMTRPQTPLNPGGAMALRPTTWATLGGVFGYDDGGAGDDRPGDWVTPYTPVEPPPPLYTGPGPGGPGGPDGNGGDGGGNGDGSGNNNGVGFGTDENGNALLHDGTIYNGQMMINDCGGYIGYVPNDFQGTTEDWWHSPHCRYQVSPGGTNIHYSSWKSQGSPSLF